VYSNTVLLRGQTCEGRNLLTIKSYLIEYNSYIEGQRTIHYCQILNNTVEISTVIDYNLIFSSNITFYERMNVNDKHATLWLQDNF
jgi:hypothetical protein